MTELEVTDKPHKNDEMRIQQTQKVGDCVARARPGYWNFPSAQYQKTPGATTSGKPKNRTATGIEKHHRF